MFTAYVSRKNGKIAQNRQNYNIKIIQFSGNVLYFYTKNLLIKQANTAEQKVAASEIITALKVFGFLHFEK